MIAEGRLLREARLTIAPQALAYPAVLEPLVAYARGHATGSAAFFREAFRPSAHIEGLRAGRFVSWDLEQYCERFTGLPAVDEHERSRRVDVLHVRSSIATAVMTLHHGPDLFTDMFLLVGRSGTWQIVNKIYHRADAG